jgi:hypothetical protein
LPLVALGGVGVAGAAVQAVRNAGQSLRGCILAAAAVAGVAWTGWSALTVWPHALCYVNELWGGTAGGYRLVNESNYDWGQGLKELADWQRAHAPEGLRVWYFGTDPTPYEPAMERLRLQDLPLQRPADILPSVRGHYFAVSLTPLCCYSDYPVAVLTREFLSERQPVARTATFFIYDFTRD